MDRRKRLAGLVVILIAAMISIAAVLLWPARNKTRISHRPVAASPPSAIEDNTNTSILSKSEATEKTVRCLSALCETGASEVAVADTRDLIGSLGATHQPFARDLSDLLESILARRSELGSASTRSQPNFSDISISLVNRAAAACEMRAQRKPDEIVLSFAGDCTFGTVNGDNSAFRFPAVYERSGEKNYPFALVSPWFVNDDLTVVNFECTLTDASRTADKQWKFKGPSPYAEIFPAGSVEAVGLSNNHSFDYLQAGFDDTVANFQKARVPEFYQNTPYVTTIKGVETVLIGDCTVVGENTTVIGDAPERVIGEIKHYKKPDNIVIVVMHWGSELDTVPRTWQQDLGRQFIDAGADAVVGHHPHVVQGIERYRGKYIAYSLGNFAFGGNSHARYPETFIFRLRFRALDGNMAVTDASIVPCLTTSSHVENTSGVLVNNYQPKPVFGDAADRIASLVLMRSAELQYGVKKLNYLKLP
ncbi:MAG: CapA family protein [Capsulimonas sp.]|uniref:CapA family protein n=1 Tax=Capsulimonas sp. TaxID=2494211 RepID=UPI00326623A6